MGSFRTVHELGKLIRKFKPYILFLIETKRKNSKVKRLKLEWSYENCLVVDSIGRGGGLALIWNTEVQLEIVSFSLFHIDAKENGDREADAWRFMAITKYKRDQNPRVCLGGYMNNILSLGFA